MADITIYHNPNCGTSRNTLAMIRNYGIEPRVIEYLKTPPTRTELVAILAAIGKPVRDVLRNKDSLYAELDLNNPKWSDDELINFAIANPILINRPIVVTHLGTRLCRPPETVLEILQSPNGAISNRIKIFN